MPTMRIGFNVRRLKGPHGYEWQGELVFPRELIEIASGQAAERRAMRVRGLPDTDQLTALWNASDYAERLADKMEAERKRAGLPAQLLPPGAAQGVKSLIERAAQEHGGGGGSDAKDKLKKVGKGAIKVGKKIFGALF